MSCFLEELKPDKNEKTDEYYRVNNVILEKQTHYLWQKFKKYYSDKFSNKRKDYKC